jgi:hypothetical protein
MTNDHLYEELHTQGHISDDAFHKLKQRQLKPLVSVYWEIKTILYLGIMLLTGGVGVLVYKNIDTIGHQIILAFIALVTGGCFTYCFKHKKPFSTARVQTPNTFFDYVLLQGTISLLIFVGYMQYQYNVFGNNYGLATFIPMLALFYIAYDFDHVGILNMAIANLGVWMGVQVTPWQLLNKGTFSSERVIHTYTCFGLLLLCAAWLTQKFIFKKHFKFSYQHYGIHITLIAMLAGYFSDYDYGMNILWLFGMLVLCAAVYTNAYKEKSFYFFLLSILYGYLAISCLVVRAMIRLDDIGAFYLLLMYFIGSAVGLIMFLISQNKKLKAA